MLSISPDRGKFFSGMFPTPRRTEQIQDKIRRSYYISPHLGTVTGWSWHGAWRPSIGNGEPGGWLELPAGSVMT